MKCSKCSEEALPGVKYCQKCKDRAATRNKKYRENPDNKQRIKENHKNWRDLNREVIAGYGQKYRDKHPETNAIRHKQYYDRNRSGLLEKSRANYIKNKEKRIAQIKKYVESRKEWYAEYRRHHYEKNKERYLALCKKYRQENPDVIYGKKVNRRARERDAFDGAINRTAVFERDNWICQLCGEPVLRDVSHNHPMYPSIDHIIPIAHGGKHGPNNVQCAHLRCNISKGSKILQPLTFPQTHSNQGDNP